MTSKAVVKSRSTIRSATIPTTVTRVVTVNKLFTLLIEVRTLPDPSLAHRIVDDRRQHETHTRIPNSFLKSESFIKFLLKITAYEGSGAAIRATVASIPVPLL
jgi:hypothetical protein